MTPEEKREGAFVEFDQLLSEALSVDDAIASIARSYEFDPQQFRSIAETHLGDLEAYRERMICRGEWTDRRTAFTQRADELRQQASARVQNTWDATMPFDPPGQPDWQYCFDRLVEDLAIEDPELRQVAHEAFFGKLKQLQTKQWHEQLRRQNASN